MSGLAITCATCSLLAKTFWYTSSGDPAAETMSSICSACCGQLLACLSRIVLPSRRFGATKRATW